MIRDMSSLGKKEEKYNAMVLKRNSVQALISDPDGMYYKKTKDACKEVGISHTSFVNYKGKEVVTEPFPPQVENRGVKKAFLNETSMDELSKWHMHLVDIQQTPPRRLFIAKIMELHANETNNVVDIVRETARGTVNRIMYLVGGRSGVAAVRSKF